MEPKEMSVFIRPKRNAFILLVLPTPGVYGTRFPLSFLDLQTHDQRIVTPAKIIHLFSYVKQFIHN